MVNLLQKYFMKDGVKVDEHQLTALHAALLNGGVFVYVPKNVECRRTNSSCISYMMMQKLHLFNHVLIVAEDK